jgi:hypothetical protein
VSDILLFLGGLSVLSATSAIVCAWKTQTARFYFIASFCLLLLEIIVPIINSVMQATSGSIWTTALRLLINGSASLLALIGLSN